MEKGWKVLARADMVGALLVAVATMLCAGPLLWGPPDGDPYSYVVIAPLVGAVFFVALVTMFAERTRHGAARLLMAAGSLVLAAVGFAYAGQVHPAKLVFFYWLPAILSISAALVLTRARRAAGIEAPQRTRRVG
ncbi:MAG: hypothetical protein ACOZIN_20450 [Myxococcota bacterium]